MWLIGLMGTGVRGEHEAGPNPPGHRLDDERGGLRTGVTPAAAAQIVLAQTLGLQSMGLRKRSIDIRARLTDSVQGLLTMDLEPVN